MAPTVDVNADLAEEITDDMGLLALVTSANVACGFHAGTPEVIGRAVAEAVRRGVTIGAQVSYADRAHFGRRVMDVAADVLEQQVADQVGMLHTIAEAEGGLVSYLKPHGALYHRCAVDPEQAAAVLAGSGDLPVLGMPGSLLLVQAQRVGRGVRLEGFPDRGYTVDGSLVPRGEPGALIEDARRIAVRAVELAGTVDSVCLHGDSPSAVANTAVVRAALRGAGIEVKTCWSSTG